MSNENFNFIISYRFVFICFCLYLRNKAGQKENRQVIQIKNAAWKQH